MSSLWWVATAFATGERVDCFPVAKQLATQVARTPMSEGWLLVVVEDSLCPFGQVREPISPQVVVPEDQRRAPTGEERAEALAAGRDPAPLGPERLPAAVAEIVATVDDALGRGRTTTVEVVGRQVRVVAGDAAFLHTRVDLAPEACPLVAMEGWSIEEAKFCVLDQIGEGTFAPRNAFPGWAAQVPNRVALKDTELLEALVRLHADNGVAPSAFFFHSGPGNPAGRQRRRIALEVYYPIFPVAEPYSDFADRNGPRHVFRPVPGDP